MKIAQLNLEKIQNETNPDFEFSNIGDVVTGVLNVIYPIIGILLLLSLLSGGLQLMTSRGDPKAVEGAKARITNSIIGVVIVFASFWIVQLLIQFLGIQTKAGGVFGVNP